MYDYDLRAVAVRLRSERGYSFRKISDLLGVSKSTIHRWMSNSSVKAPRTKISLMKLYGEFIGELLSENPSYRLKDLRDQISKKYNRTISLSSVCRCIRLLGLSYKKSTFQQYTKWDKLRLAREEFNRQLTQIPKNRIVCLDESYFYERLCRSYGYSSVGEKCTIRIPCGMKKISLMLAVSMDNVLAYEVSHDNYNRKNFYAFLKDKLLPQFTGKFILMDNASFHKCKEIKKLIADSNNQTLFIPPYSPQYNPVEVVFHMFKSVFSNMLIIKINHVEHYLSSINLSVLKRIYEHCLRP